MFGLAAKATGRSFVWSVPTSKGVAVRTQGPTAEISLKGRGTFLQHFLKHLHAPAAHSRGFAWSSSITKCSLPSPQSLSTLQWTPGANSSAGISALQPWGGALSLLPFTAAVVQWIGECRGSAFSVEGPCAFKCDPRGPDPVFPIRRSAPSFLALSVGFVYAEQLVKWSWLIQQNQYYFCPAEVRCCTGAYQSTWA